MRLAPVSRRKRSGFTLIEMIVVVVIILILAGLISAAAIRALGKAREVRNRNDISGLASAVENFKTKFGFYPPSRIRLCKSYARYLAAPTPPPLGGPLLDQDSVQLITRMFPRIDLNGWATVGIDWNGAGLTTDSDVILEGDQCLVFFLGGIQRPPSGNVPAGCLGFSTSPANPGAPTNDRIGPFYEFQGGRLVLGRPGPNGIAPINISAPTYLSYADVYSTTSSTPDPLGVLLSGAPYAYFSSYKTTNGYNRYGTSDWGGMTGTPVVSPYVDPAGRFINPNTFQIISAGKDGLFGGGGGPWSPATASIYPGTTYGSPGYDDQANFYEVPLGIETK
jgi:general secretion pathway protein G